jgi:hypothetical protein
MFFSQIRRKDAMLSYLCHPDQDKCSFAPLQRPLSLSKSYSSLTVNAQKPLFSIVLPWTFLCSFN